MQPLSIKHLRRIFGEGCMGLHRSARYVGKGVVACATIGWSLIGAAHVAHPQAPIKTVEMSAAADSRDTGTGKTRHAPIDNSLADISTTDPKSVYVAVSQAELYSGPSTDFYPTGRVPRGMALEAYHRTADGWLGIRPPEGSFSWVPASDAYLLPGGRVIEITSQHAVSWIGSALGSAKQYRWQVELQPGEQLAVLGEMTNKTEGGQESLWYKIGPPAGEFRWIHEKAISLTAVAPADRQVTIPAKNAVTSASHQKRAKGAEVQAADFSEDVFAEGTVVYGDTYAEGPTETGLEIVDGEVIEDGQYYDDGSYIEGGEFVYESSNSSAKGNGWDGWHAIELTDEGFRIPFLERRYQQAQARKLVDPLNHDPFSLSMPDKVVEPRSVRQDVRQNLGVAPERRFTPWRDPRDLRSKRMQGNIGDSYYLSSSTDSAPRDVARQEPQTEESKTTSEELLARLVSTVKNASPEDSQVDRGIVSDSESKKTEQWFGVNALANPTDNRGVNSLELGQLQLVLSEMVAQPMNAWNLQPLMDRAKHFIEHGASAIERGQARLMLERIEDFDRLAKKSGMVGFGSVLTASATQANGISPTPQSNGIATAGYDAALNPNIANQGNYDATGWLVQVRAAAAGQPTHAITNDAGQVIAYVSGLPGMNLDIYINQAVGITGLRGFLPQLQAQHIQAQRVVRLR